MQTPPSITDQVRTGVLLAFRWRRRMFGMFSAIILLTLLVICLSPRAYKSEARFLVRLGRESVGMDPTATAAGPMMGVNESRESEIRSALEILYSRDVAVKAVDELTPEYVLNPHQLANNEQQVASTFSWGATIGSVLSTIGLSDPVSKQEKAVKELQEAMSASIPSRSNVIVFSCESETAEHAQELAKQVTKEFLESHLKAHRTSQAVEFFQTQSEHVYTKLNSVNDELRQVKTDYGIASIQGQRDSLQDQIHKSRVLEQQVVADLAASDAKAGALEQELQTLPKELETLQVSVPSKAQETMRDRLYQLQIEQQDRASRMTPKHPLRDVVTEQVKESRKILDAVQTTRDQKTVTVNPNQRPLQLELMLERARGVSLKSQLSALQKQTADLVKQLDELHTQTIKIEDIEREAAILSGNYQSYLEKLEEARVDRVLELERISNISVIQSPTLVHKPAKPQKMLLCLAGFFFACVGAFGTAFISHAFDDRSETSNSQADDSHEPNES